MTLPKYDATRPIIAFDFETSLFDRGCMAPPMSCAAFAWREGSHVKTELLSHREGAREVMDLLRRAIAGEITLALQNGPYDFAVLAAEYPEALPLIFDAHEAGAIHDTLAAEWLNDCAVGLLRMEQDEDGEWKSKKRYSLENLARLHLGWPPYKDDWRMRYGELRDAAIADYPEGARVYPKKDAEATLLVAERQREIAAGILPHDPLVAALAHVCRTYLALHFVSCWGQELDPERVERFAVAVEDYSASFVPALERAGLVVRTAKGKNAGKLTKKLGPLREMVAIDLAHRGAVDPLASLDEWPEDLLTDGGAKGVRQIKCSREVLAECENPTLRIMAEYLEAEKLRTAFVEPLRRFGAGPTHARYGFAETGRTTCSGGSKRNRMSLNDQQLPRRLPKGLAERMRELWGEEIDLRSCYVAREGCVLSSTDYAALEMCTLAQACRTLVGYSTLGDALNEGVDPHTLFASDLLGCSYEEAVARVKAKDPAAKDARQRAKVANFGYPGGLGARKFVRYAKAQGIAMTEAESKRLRELYLGRWKELRQYFDRIGSLVGDGSATVIGLESDMVRGGVGYTDACNGYFQGLAAYGATAALWKIVRECYDERLGSPLFGSRVRAFVHDELIAEHPIATAHEAAERLALVAREVMQEIVPHVIIKAEPALMARWFKNAETVRDARGKLIAWEPHAA